MPDWRKIELSRGRKLALRPSAAGLDFAAKWQAREAKGRPVRRCKGSADSLDRALLALKESGAIEPDEVADVAAYVRAVGWGAALL